MVFIAEQGITEGIQKLEKEGLKKFLLKFNDATCVNNSGLAIDTSRVSEGKKRKQTFAASGLSKHFQEVFDVIGLTEFLDIYARKEEAIRRL